MTTRDKIIEAARRVMQTKGLTQATTKEIAQAAGVSEGSLYNHFKNKLDLFINVLRTSPSNFIGLVTALRERAGSGTVRENLEEVAIAALAFYTAFIPTGASIFSDPELLALYQKEMQGQGAGPRKGNVAVAAYLRAEQALGRVRADADPDITTYLLLGACFQQAFWSRFSGEEPAPETEKRFVQDILDTLMEGLTPT